MGERGLCFFTPLPAPVFARRRAAVRSIRGGIFLLEKPISATFLSRGKPAFCKKISRARTHRIPRYGNFRAAPPAPCRRARRRADNPADEPVHNTDNRICRVRRSRTSPRRTSARRSRTSPPATQITASTEPVGVGRTHAVHPTARTPAVQRVRTPAVQRVRTPTVHRRHRRPSPTPTTRRVCKSHRSRLHPPSRTIRNYASYIRAWQSADSPSADIGDRARRENRRHLPNTQMFSAHNKLIINNRIRNIHHKTPNYIHLARKIRAEHTQSSHTRNSTSAPIRPPTLFFAKKSATSISLKLIITTETAY